jgi:hypothetical protein
MEQESKKSSDDLNPNLTSDRQVLIETAVRFLKNPKVLPTSSDNKKMFLSKKGKKKIFSINPF